MPKEGNIPYGSTRQSLRTAMPSRFVKFARSKIYSATVSDLKKRHIGLFHPFPVTTLIERPIVHSNQLLVEANVRFN